MNNIAMPKLGAELDKESYIWMASNHSNILEAIEAEVTSGSTPQQIRVFVLRQTGRPDIAARCEQASRYLAQSAA